MLFHDMVDRNRVVEVGAQMFDKKPVTVKAGKPDMDFTKTQMEKNTVWVRISGSGHQILGQGCTD